ncbi:hypothetical protein KBC04_02670 [Candidatus Babeliales bacterium]|nr:hypothetical protein [Candidatus Babeliales bacterium]MBP9844044.1 hypothetical protein [Candidatus Babeliales bacterium]
MSYKNLTQQELIEILKDESQADTYFHQGIEECKKVDKQKAQELLIIALKNIAQAQGGLVNNLSYVLPESGSKSLYKTLSSVMVKLVI